ncbi:MAG: hypothetical protein OXC40_04235, partial [Proteobacteria bacterium]|nr:hypothetical protein [Pseudomonadota bacterium]
LLTGFSIGIGTVSIGQGGPNPPMNHPGSWQLTLFNKHHELILSIIPGIYYALRSADEGFYVSLGGGLMYSLAHPIKGLDFGATAGFGFNLCRLFCIGIEYRAAMGIDSYYLPHKFKDGHYSMRLMLGMKW